MFNNLLIANRGEIACRIMRTAQELCIPTTAVFSEADAGAPFVKMAGQKIAIGPAQVAQSYLDIDKIITAARDTRADAIHPGYGLLSENANFARAVAKAGLTFVGPSAKTIGLLGDKMEAKKIMRNAGIPVVPGSDDVVKSYTEAQRVADRLGYPLLIKAVGGGGGIGLSKVERPEQLQPAFTQCTTAASRFFGNGFVFIEKYLDGPRHIEVQIVADMAGKTLHLNERECSIQRRHQKIVEETPSMFLDKELREKICRLGVRAAETVGYLNVGTVEFLVDAHKNIYFLEMNTRLQVEHPVTEMTTGVDMVALQLRIAAGENLYIDQGNIPRQGHSIECRVCAEDPNTYYPSPGKITVWKVPHGPHVRVDSGVEEGSEVTIFYDPLLAKLIVWGEDRNEAIYRMSKALDDFEVEGVKTNIPLLKKIMLDADFVTGNYNVHFLMTRPKEAREIKLQVSRTSFNIKPVSTGSTMLTRRMAPEQLPKPKE